MNCKGANLITLGSRVQQFTQEGNVNIKVRMTSLAHTSKQKKD